MHCVVVGKERDGEVRVIPFQQLFLVILLSVIYRLHNRDCPVDTVILLQHILPGVILFQHILSPL